SAGGPLPARKIPLKDTAVDFKVKKCAGKSVEVPRTDGIDTTARAVLHELEHKRLSDRSAHSQDRDKDGVDDAEESTSEFCLNRYAPNTHQLRPEDLFVMRPGDDALFNPPGGPKGGKGGQGKNDDAQKSLDSYGDAEVLAAAAERKYEAS